MIAATLYSYAITTDDPDRQTPYSLLLSPTITMEHILSGTPTDVGNHDVTTVL